MASNNKAKAAAASAAAAPKEDAAAASVVAATPDQAVPVATVDVQQTTAETAALVSDTEAHAAEVVQQDATDELGKSEFPMRVRVTNNTGFPIAEPVTGAFIGTASAEVILLPDADTAQAVADSLKTIAASLYVPIERIVIDVIATQTEV